MTQPEKSTTSRHGTSKQQSLFNRLNNLISDELRKAHKLNDIAVCEVYSFDKDISEDDIVAKLMRLYQALAIRL
ncbi:MAG: hypothetical protein IJ667_00080 [Synergistaceae bacterium]|nr:hypothetical protein [Synergistaceae bacterium]